MNENGFPSADAPLMLHCIGVEFCDVPATVRDAIALSPAQTSEALATISTVLPAAEAVVLATCNRTELYVVEAGDPERLDLWHRTVGRQLDDSGCPAAAAARFHLTGDAAAEHLFAVTAGLRSSDLGDTEIAGQVRRARDLAADAGTVGPVLHRLFDLASRAGRRARSETLISAGGSGVGLATANTIAASAPSARCVTVLGAGDAANAVCRELRKRTSVELRIVNRTRGRAEALADRYAATAFDLDELERALHGADVVVTALRGDAPALDGAVVARVRRTEPAWRPLAVDTCVPRMVDPGVDLPVIHLDDQCERDREVRRVRTAAVPAVEEVVADTLEEFCAWLRDRALSDVIAELYREADAVTAEAAGLVEDERTAREIHRAVRRLVHDHITRLRALDDAVDARPRKEPQR